MDISRGRFLILSLLLGYAGAAYGVKVGDFSLINSLLGTLALLLLHISVNAINSSRDYRSGIDRETEKTAFSGGPSALVEEKLSYEDGVYLSIVSALLSAPIFAYFYVKYSDPFILLVASLGILLVYGYTDILSRAGLGEIAAGLGLGSLPFLMIAYLQSGQIPGKSLLYTSLLLGIPTFDLLLINHLPDMKADRKHGRRTIPLLAGRKGALVIYMASILLLNGAIFAGYFAGSTPVALLPSALISWLGLGCGFLIYSNGYSVDERILGLNVLWTHLFLAVLGTGLIFL